MAVYVVKKIGQNFSSMLKIITIPRAMRPEGSTEQAKTSRITDV
jgi:hypothetical protein